MIEPQLRRQDQEGHVDGVAQVDRAVFGQAQAGLVAECGAGRQGIQRRGRGARHRVSFVTGCPLCPVAAAGDVDADRLGLAVEKQESLHGQLVLGQGPGLVGGDDRAGAQPLDRGQGADDDLAPQHPVGGDCQGHRDGDRQAFGDRRDRERDRDQEDRDQR